MEKLYYHPERRKLRNMPVFVDANYCDALKYFLRLAEAMEPQMIKDIEAIIPIFSQAEILHEQFKIDRSFIDDWSIIESCDENNKSYLLELKNALLSWASKYNLYNGQKPNNTFLEIALWAIPDRRDHEKNIEDRKKFLESLGFKDINYDEKWSIANVIYEEDEAEILKERVSFDKLFPFVFSPSFFNIHGRFSNARLEPLATDYECLLSDYRLNLMLTHSKEREILKDFHFGVGWDPRTTMWSEFEESIDEAYKKYKKLYKERTKAYMKQNSYVEGIQKRNKEHFIWLIMYQILQTPISTIADCYSEQGKNLAEDTIRKGISAAAKAIDLPLR